MIDSVCNMLMYCEKKQTNQDQERSDTVTFTNVKFIFYL